MEHADMIPADEFCIHHHISYTFISGLHEAGLVEVVTVEEKHYLHAEQLHDLEKLVRFHTEMDINMEGIEAIAHLLQQMTILQSEMRKLQQRLNLYEDNP